MVKGRVTGSTTGDTILGAFWERGYRSSRRPSFDISQRTEENRTPRSMNFFSRYYGATVIDCLLSDIAMLPGCASPQDQFGYAVMKGDTNAAQQFIAPRYARMTITESNGQKSVPIQYAIVQRNKEMASFLLANDCHKTIGGNNLVYSVIALAMDTLIWPSFSHHEAKVHTGTSKVHAKIEFKAGENADAGGLILLGVLAAMIGGGGGSSSQPSELDPITYMISGSTCPGCGKRFSRSVMMPSNYCDSCRW